MILRTDTALKFYFLKELVNFKANILAKNMRF